MTSTASPFAKLKMVVVLFTSASGLLLHPKIQQRRSYVLSSIYGDAANENYLNDKEWWEKVSTNEPISNYQQEDKISIDYFFPESTSERINYKIPAEMLGDKRIQKAIVQDLIVAVNSHKNLQGRSSLARAKNNLVDLYFVGVGTTAHLKDGKSLSSPICLFVAPSSTQRRFPAIAVPSTAAAGSDKFLQLLTTTYQNKPISQAKCFPLNSILVNKDDGIFDNIPWNTWSLQGNRKEKDFDAAGNRVDIKYRFGKRDAYERFMGKDLSDATFSIGTMAALLLDQSEKNEKKVLDSMQVDGNTFDERARKILLQRILKIELEEAQSKLAGVEQQLALHRNSNNNSGNSSREGEKESELLQVEVAKHQKRLQDAQDALEAALRNQNEASIIISVLRNIFNRSQLTVDGKKNTAPYKGAYGYAASSVIVGDDTSTMEKRHTGPFDILNDLIKTQLRSNIIGIFLENISYDEGLVQLGGACVIQRQAPPKGSKGQIKIATETVDVPVLQDEEGEVRTGDVYIVECDAEEAIALSLTTSFSISIEKSLWESLSVDVSNALEEKGKVTDFLPRIDVAESEFSLLSIKEQSNRSSGSSAGDNSPRTTLSMFAPSSTFTSSSTNNDIVEKIPSLDVYDSLSIEEKAKILRQSNSFAGNRLPRPRVIKLQSGGSLNSLDRLLIPLVDEAVRRDYLIREARKRKDSEALDKLTKNCSKRQIAMMLARMARNEGKNDIAKIWEEEADLLKTLRADITQDENSYSSFLDKDEWYERQRLAAVSKLKKSNFGTLLDGIE